MRLAFIALLALAACQQEQAAAPAAAPVAIEPMSGPIVAQGDGWELSADPAANTILIRRAAGEEVTAPYAAPARTDTGWTLTSGTVSATLETGECTRDEIRYPMRATVVVGGRTLTGCAAERWDAYLMQHMATIDACIARSPRTRYVTYAGDDGHGQTVVRLRGFSGQQDCRVRNGEVEFYPREAAVVVPTEYEATFVRAEFDGTGENPGGECYQAPEVRRDGVLLGWMDDPQNC